MKRSGPIRRRRALRRTNALRARTQPRKPFRVRPGWWQLRKLVEGRADGRCELNCPGCPPGVHRGRHAHHVLPRSHGGPDDLGNLLWCCPAGHQWVHEHPAASYEAGWLRRTAA